MRFLKSLVVLLVLPSAVFAAEVPADVRDAVTKRVDSAGATGIVVGVVDAGGPVYFSRGSVTKGGPAVSENSVFEIGSVTKVFTSLLLADMAGRGIVAIEDPITKFLPDGATVPIHGDRPITLGSLGHHRSGLPRLPDNMDPADPGNPYADYTEARLLAFLASYELPRDVGEKYEYSNLGAGLLGYLLSRKAGTTYEALAAERILKPLQMKDSGITLTEGLRARLAIGHDAGKPVMNWDFDALAGAGAIRSTAADMTLFLRAAMGLDATPLSGAFGSMLEATTDGGALGVTVGLGWHVQNQGGTTTVWHNGGTGGYRSFIGYRPDTEIGVVVLTNSTEDIDDIGRHLLDPALEMKAPRVMAAVTPARLDEYAGFYELAPGAVFEITREEDQLYAMLTGQGKLPVFADSDSSFFYKVVDARITFKRGAGGKVDRLVLNQNGVHTAKRLDNYTPPMHVEVAVDAAILKTYEGKYELQPGVFLVIRAEGPRLSVKLADQPWYPVFPESETTFFYKVVEAQLAFQKNDAGRVTGLVLHQSGMSQSAKKVG